MHAQAPLIAARAQARACQTRQLARRGQREITALRDLRRALSDNNEESRRIVQKLAELAERQESVLKEKGGREAEKRAVQEQIAELDKHNADAARRMERQLLRSQRAQTAFDSLTRDELMARNEIEKVRERLDSLIADNEEKYPYPADFVPGDESADKLENSCRYLERSLKELGDVNMGALSEDQSLAERLEFLGGQLKDVQQGMDELRALIANTDKQAGTMFNGALVKIDRRFDELFQRLFGGAEFFLALAGGAGENGNLPSTLIRSFSRSRHGGQGEEHGKRQYDAQQFLHVGFLLVHF